MPEEENAVRAPEDVWIDGFGNLVTVFAAPTSDAGVNARYVANVASSPDSDAWKAELQALDDESEPSQDP